MWRTRAVVSLLTEEVAGVTPEESVETAARSTSDFAVEPYLEALDRSIRRGRWFVLLDWTAILVLFLTRDRTELFLQLGRSESAVFSLAVLAVAVHSGFRLGQVISHGSVRRACLEVASR